MSDEFRAATDGLVKAIQGQNSLKTSKFLISSAGKEKLDGIISDRNMTIWYWLEVNYPTVKIIENESGYAA